MTLAEAKQQVKAAINGRQGCKGTEVPALLAYWPEVLDHDLTKMLDELVQDGELVEVEYSLPCQPERVKSFYLPAGTEVKIPGAYVFEGGWG